VPCVSPAPTAAEPSASSLAVSVAFVASLSAVAAEGRAMGDAEVCCIARSDPPAHGRHEATEASTHPAARIAKPREM
jgi:hypothetical protein